MSSRSIGSVIVRWMGVRMRVLVTACVCLGVAAGLMAGVAEGAVNLRAAGLGAPEPTVNTTMFVDGKADGTVPDPPADVMGTPSDSTLVSSDQLYVTIASSGTIYNQWAKVVPTDLSGGIYAWGNAGRQSAQPMLTPNVATAAGRFLDPMTARVLSLQLSKLGDDGLLTLSSSNQTADPEWGTKPVDTCAAGDTCALEGDGGDLTVSDDTADTPVSVTGVGPGGPSGQPATGQQWTFIDAGDGYFQIVNKSDGLCLSSVQGSEDIPVVVCADPATAPGSQLWRLDPTGVGSTVAIQSELDEHTYVGLLPGTPAFVEQSYGSFDSQLLFHLTALSEPDGAIPTWSTAIPNASPATPYAVAAGDLDRVVGADNQYHDEAVVAYAGPQHHLQVRVIDYNANPSHLLVSTPDVVLPVVGAVKDGTWFPGSVGVAVGSFDGGPLNQIAVTWQDADGHFHVTLLQYHATADGGRALTVLGDPAGISLFPDATTTNSLASGYDQTVAGDFEGIGRDDLAIAYAGINPDGSNADSGHLGVVSFTRQLTVRGQTTRQFSVEAALLNEEHDDGTWTSHGVRVVPGLFRFDPSKGFDFRRRELAVAWTEHVRDDLIKDRVQLFDTNDSAACTDDTCALSIDDQGAVNDVRDENPGGGDSLPISLTSGGFAGQGSGGDPPLWGVVVWFSPLSPGTDGRLATLKATDTGLENGELSTETGSQYVLTAYDRAGSSLALGPPLILTVSHLVHAKLIAAQPPSHSDWIDGQMINVSRNGFFVVKTGDQETKNYAYSTTTKAGWNVGVTQSADLKAGVTVGDEKIGPTVSGSWEVSQKFAANWSETDSAFNQYSTTLQSSTQQTGLDDDLVDGDFVTDYVYRYPILGRLPDDSSGKSVLPAGCSSGPCTPFYEVTIPGQVEPLDGLGKSLEDFYEPTWQNGNALSYPTFVNGAVPTPDLGSYSYTDAQGHTTVETKPLFNENNDVGGGQATDDLTITGQTGSGHQTDTANDWSLSSELTGRASFQESVGLETTKAKLKFSIGVNGGKTFASSDSGSTTSTSAKSFELDVPGIDANKGYEIGTAYYDDTAGAAQVVHAVDLTANSEGREFWERIYGVHPDPALNLPNQTFVTYDNLNVFDKVVFNTNANRQLIRGFYALQPDNPSSPLTSGVPYASDPLAGDPVIFSVKVHNYSLVDSPAFPVQFYAVPVDASGLNVSGAPVSLGTVQSLPIPAQGMVTVDAPAWSAQTGRWRIFVVVDPDNTLDEIHPWKGQPPCPTDALDPQAAPGTVVNGKMIDPMTGGPDELSCGQNNQGYGDITVMPTPAQSAGAPKGAPNKHEHHHRHHRGGQRASAGVIAASLGAAGPAEPAGATLASSQMAIAGSGGDLRLTATTTPSDHLGEPMTVVIHATSATGTADILPVVVYDGPPSHGHLIAATELDGATKADGGDATFTWTPDTPGLHTLYEEMLGADPSEDSRQTMNINVLPTLEKSR